MNSPRACQALWAKGSISKCGYPLPCPRHDFRGAACAICSDQHSAVHPKATEKEDGCPYREKSDPASRVVEVRKICGRTGYRMFDGAAPIEYFDYFRNAMRFAKRFAKVLNKNSVCYVRMCPYGCCPEQRRTESRL